MSTNAIDNSTPLEWASMDSAGLNAQSRMPVTTLTQDDFLSLLVAQMTNQDPLKPMEDMSSFMQIAQFSTLEQTKSMQQSMATIHANSMLGHMVQINDGSGEPLFGMVHQVLMIDGAPQVVVNGQRFSLDKVEAIGTPASTTVPDPDDTTNTTAPPVTPELGPAPSLPQQPDLGAAPSAPVTADLGGAPRF